MLFSVITPTIGRESILNTGSGMERQSMTDFEWIIVKDGPDVDLPIDGTELPNMRIMETPEITKNWGNTQRDLAISVAQGRYVCFVDDDDEPLPWFLDAFQLKDGNWDMSVQCFLRSPGYAGSDVIGLKFLKCHIGGQCVAVKTEIAQQVRWDANTSNKSDWAWMSAIKEMCDTVHFTQQIGMVVHPSYRR